MKNIILALPIGFLWSFLGLFAGHSASPQQPAPDPLAAILKKMDATAASFRNTQAEFEWDNYQKVIDEVDDVETGTVYYRRAGKDIEMMAEVKKAGASAKEMKPDPKFVLFSGGKIRLYQPKVDQVTEYDLGKNKADFESYLVLGFGGSGQDLVKSFDVTYLGTQAVAGMNAAKLQLVPKSERVRGTFNKILLWIDPDKGISVQQQFFDPQGNNRLTTYSSIQMNGKKIPDEVFRLKTTGKTTTISPRG